jgi:tetratricopeptide (TPR) repeat protein
MRVWMALAGVVVLPLAGVAFGQAGGGRAVLPDRIPWKEEFGGSDFARALHELSERGELDAGSGQGPAHPPAWWWHGRRDRSRWWYWDPWDDPYPYGIDGRLVVRGVQPGSGLSMPAASPPAPPPPPPLTTLERARLAFARGDHDGAVDAYRAHLAEEPDDFEAAVEMGAALIDAGRVDDGVSVIALAYRTDPGLAYGSVSDRVSVDPRRWRALVVRAVRQAHRRDSASGWLAVAVLMQAEGRKDVALRMVERAEQHGLEGSVASQLAAVLR